jgi:hypothetical protein
MMTREANTPNAIFHYPLFSIPTNLRSVIVFGKNVDVGKT